MRPAGLASGVLAHAGAAGELRDWARVVVCIADLGDAAREPEGGRVLAAIWGATDGEKPDQGVLVVLRRLVRRSATAR